EASSELADSAEQSAQRRIDAAIRAGKQVTDEIDKVKALGQEYARIGFNPQQGSTTTSGAPAPGSPQATAPAPTLPGGDQIARVIDEALVAAVNAASAANNERLDAIAAAVRALAEEASNTTKAIGRVETAVRSIDFSGGVR